MSRSICIGARKGHIVEDISALRAKGAAAFQHRSCLRRAHSEGCDGSAVFFAQSQRQLHRIAVACVHLDGVILSFQSFRNAVYLHIGCRRNLLYANRNTHLINLSRF